MRLEQKGPEIVIEHEKESAAAARLNRTINHAERAFELVKDEPYKATYRLKEGVIVLSPPTPIIT